MKIQVLICLILVTLFQLSEQRLGIDAATLVTEDDFKCLKTKGYDFSVIRGYHSYGGVDRNAKTSISNSKAAGLTTSAYHFPCIGKVTPQEQAQAIVSYLGDLPLMYWIDIETNPSSGCGWRDATYNCHTPGIYASAYEWETIFGSKTACPNFANYNLWYAHYDSNPSFSDFQSFAGWNTPTYKQFKGTTTECGVSVDLNYQK